MLPMLARLWLRSQLVDVMYRPTCCAARNIRACGSVGLVIGASWEICSGGEPRLSRIGHTMTKCGMDRWPNTALEPTRLGASVGFLPFPPKSVNTQGLALTRGLY